MRRRRLALKFRDQEAFSRDYSPLYARLFGLIAGWLEAPSDGPNELASWLVQVAGHRRSLEVTLLLAAGLHRDVLAGEPAAAELSRFYPTAGGESSPDAGAFEPALRQAIDGRRDVLAAFIGGAQVQTNETGRGLCWLLPTLLTRWPVVRLVDLGASAGLNLVAEQRAFRLVDAGSQAALFDLGLADPVQFQTRCYGWAPSFSEVDGRALPHIAARDGCDLTPFPLDDREHELTLMSFVWGDQHERLQRLREGIAAFRCVNQGDAPVRLLSADLPDDLGRFLQAALSTGDPGAPVIIYNTWVTSYLKDLGQSMGFHIDQWAARQDRPVLWLQWEPDRDGKEPPHYGWCDWTAELWRGEERRHWHLGWVHPHGGKAQLEPGLVEYRLYWSE